MSERIQSNIAKPEHHTVSPLRYTFVFLTLLIGAAITVVAAKLEAGIFNPAL